MSLDALIAEKQGGIAVEDEPAGGLDALIAEKQGVVATDELSLGVSQNVFDVLFLDKPIEELLPTEQSEIAGSILDSFEDPKRARNQIINTFLLSELFDVPHEQIQGLESEILKQMFGDPLTSLRDTFQEKPVEGGFFSKMGEAFKRGNEAISSDIAVYDSVFGGQGNIDNILEIRRKKQLGELLSPIEGNMLTDLFYKSAQIAPGMARGFWDAVPEAFAGMLAGAGVAAIAGQAGPQIVLPEEVITVPVAAAGGAAIGLKAGATMFWYKQGAGSMVATMLENDYDSEISMNVAGIAAIPYALIELSQVSKLTPGLRQTINKSLQKTTLKILGAAVKKYGTTLTGEVLEEVAQEIITVAAEDIAGILSKEDIPFDAEYIRSRSNRLWQTAKESTKAMALLPLPGVGIDVFTGIKAKMTVSELNKISKQLTPVVAKRENAIIDDAIGTQQFESEGQAKQFSEDIAGMAENQKRDIKIDVTPDNEVTVTPIEAPVADVEAEAPAEPTVEPPITAEAKPEAVEGKRKISEIFEDEPTPTAKPEAVLEPDQPPVGAAVIEPEIEVAPITEPTEGVLKEKIPIKAPTVKPVLPTKIVSPGEAGPFKVTFKAAEGLPATRVIVDPQVRRSVQSAENKIAGLRTKLKQAIADKKQAVVAATEKQIARAEVQIAKLKERQQIKLTTTIEKAKTKVLKLQQAVKFKDSLRRDAISLIQAIPKDLQPGFIKRASEATTLKSVQRLANEIQAGLDRAEKQESIKTLKAAAQAINPRKMLPEFAGIAQAIKDSLQLGKPQAEVIAKASEIKAMAKQVLENSREDSVATIQAQRVLDEVNQKTSKTFAINQLSIEAIDQITDTLIALRFQNEADTIAAKDENATEAVRRRKLITESIVEIPDVPESLGGKGVRKFKLVHDNLESVLDAVAGARPGTYDLWIKSKNPTTQFIYDVLDAGVDQQILHSEKARDTMRDILDNNDVSSSDILNWSMRPEDVSKVKKAFGIAPKPVVHKFTLKNAKNVSTPFDFTTNEIMSIFMHSRNSHNLDVLLNDGLNRIVDGKKQKIRGFTVDIVDDMTASLADQQKNVARQVSTRLMDGLNKDAGNKTSVKLEFFEILRVNNYWPANRSIIRGPKGKKPTGLTKTIESLAFLKERVGTGNPLKFAGFFETVHNVNKNMASYVGLAEPLREVKAVYTPEVIESLEDDGRGDQAKAITELIERFEDPKLRIEGKIDEVVATMLGGFAKSQLFLKPRLAVRQQLSSLLISAYVDPKYMTEFKGIGTAELNAEIKALSPQFGARADGLQFDRDTGDAFVENQLMNYLTGDTSAIDKTAVPMKFFDNNAIVDIYRATKAEVVDAGVDINTIEGKAILKDRFEWVARHTQPMWHPKDRSLLGSDPRPLVRSLTMFMSQREQMVRMVNNGIADFANSDKTAEDQVRLGRSLGAVALNMVLFTLYNIAWAKFIQKKERDVKDLGKAFLKDLFSLPFFGSYLATSFELVFSVFTDKPTFFQDFNKSPIESILGNVLLVAIPNFARAGKHFVTGEKYGRGSPRAGELKWKNELLVAVDGLASAFAALRGIPYAGGKELVKTAEAQFTEPEKKRRKRR